MDLFGIGGSELLVLVLLAGVLLGPQRLARLARDMGSLLGQVRARTGDLTKQLNREIDVLEALEGKKKGQATAASPAEKLPEAYQRFREDFPDEGKLVDGRLREDFPDEGKLVDGRLREDFPDEGKPDDGRLREDFPDEGKLDNVQPAAAPVDAPAISEAPPAEASMTHHPAQPAAADSSEASDPDPAEAPPGAPAKSTPAKPAVRIPAGRMPAGLRPGTPLKPPRQTPTKSDKN